MSSFAVLESSTQSNSLASIRVPVNTGSTWYKLHVITALSNSK